MQRLVRVALAATLAAAAASAVTQDGQDNPACAALAAVALPVADEPDAAARTRLAGCASETLYYADGGTPDYRDARLCAYLERSRGDELVFGGSAVLMMIYANGDGIARNLPLAKKFACETGGAPAELDGRLRHLDEIGQQSGTAERFDLCDDVTSGYMMGFCASRHADAAKVARDRGTNALTATWSAAQRGALATLRKAADRFFDASVDGEVDMSGTARGALAVGARDDLESGFATALAAFERGELPTGDAAAFAAADTALNATYATVMKRYKADSAEGIAGTVTPEGIRQAQRAWIGYRDAWVVFGASRYPAVAAEAWKTHFTREREQALKALVE